MVAFPTFEERPDLLERWAAMPGDAWPPGMEFIYHDPVLNEFWPRLKSEFAAYQFLAVDDAGSILGQGRSIPIRWDGLDAGLPDGLPSILKIAFSEKVGGIASTALCALLVTVEPEAQGRGLSAQMLGWMKRLAARDGLGWVVAPVRPTEKSRHPHMPMEQYATWRRDDGQLVDPWLRTHERIGGRYAGIAPIGNRFVGTIAEWEQWTGRRLRDSGEYVVPGALNPVDVDVSRDIAVLTEPNVWMVHRVITDDDARVAGALAESG